MKLYNYWRSSCSWRVRIALAYKKVPYDYVAVHLLREGGEQYKEDHRARNPMAQVPVLEIREEGKPQILGQSMAILEYLEELYPIPSLLPRSPIERGWARQEAEIINSGIQPFQGLLVGKKVEELGGTKKAWIQFWVGQGLLALEEMVKRTHGTFCVKNTLSYADVLLIPQLYAARRFEVDLNGMTTLLEIEKRCMDMEAFQVSHPDRQPDAENNQ